MEYNIDKSAIIGPRDSSFKVFFKEFFTNSRTRYSVETPLNKDDPNVVKGSPKDNFWQTNLLKIALCFTIVVPIAAGIYKLVEMQKLKNYKFVPMKSSNEPPKEGSEKSTIDKVSRLQPGSKTEKTSTFKVADSAKHTQPLVYKIEVSSEPTESLERLFNYLYVSYPEQKKTFEEFKTLTELKTHDKVFVCEVEDEQDQNMCQLIGRSKEYFGVNQRLIDKFEKDEALQIEDRSPLMRLIQKVVQDKASKIKEEPLSKPVNQEQKPASTTTSQKETPLVTIEVPSTVNSSEKKEQRMVYALGISKLHQDNFENFFKHLYSSSSEANQKLLNEFRDLNQLTSTASRKKVKIDVLKDSGVQNDEFHLKGSLFEEHKSGNAYLEISTNLFDKFDKNDPTLDEDVRHFMEQIQRAVNYSKGVVTQEKSAETSPVTIEVPSQVGKVKSDEMKPVSEKPTQPLIYKITALAYGSDKSAAATCERLFNNVYVDSDEIDKKLLNEFKELNERTTNVIGRVKIEVQTDHITVDNDDKTLHANGSFFTMVGLSAYLNISTKLLKKFDEKGAILDTEVEFLKGQIKRAVNHSKGVVSQEKPKPVAPSEQIVSTKPTQPVEYKLSAIIGFDKSTQDVFEEFFKYLYSKSENNKKLLNEFKELNERATFALGKVKIQVEEDYKVQDEEQKTFHAKGSSFKLYGKNPFLDISKNLLDKFDKKDRSLDTDVEYLMGEIQKAIEHSRKPKSKQEIVDRKKETAPPLTEAKRSSPEIKTVSEKSSEALQYQIRASGWGLDQPTQEKCEQFFNYLYSSSGEANHKLLNEYRGLKEHNSLDGKVSIEVHKYTQYYKGADESLHEQGSSCEIIGGKPYIDISTKLLDKFNGNNPATNNDPTFGTDVAYLMEQIRLAVEDSKKPKA